MIETFVFKRSPNGPIQDGDISDVREAPLRLSDNGLSLWITSVMGFWSRQPGVLAWKIVNVEPIVTPFKCCGQDPSMRRSDGDKESCDGFLLMDYCSCIVFLQLLSMSLF